MRSDQQVHIQVYRFVIL